MTKIFVTKGVVKNTISDEMSFVTECDKSWRKYVVAKNKIIKIGIIISDEAKFRH